MKIKYVLAIASSCVLNHPSAHAASVGDLLKNVSPEKMCQKANIFEGKVTIRSFNGALCSNQTVALFSERVCPQYSKDYKDSKCHAIAVKTLKGLKQKDIIKNAKGDEKKLLEKAGITPEKES